LAIDKLVGGLAVAKSSISSPRFWRQLTSCIVAYVLVLQGILLGLNGLSLALSDPADRGLPGFEICLNGSTGDAPSSADLPRGHTDGTAHCKFCVLGALQFPVVPTQSLLPFAIVDSGQILWPAPDWRDAISLEYPSQRPRGPPLTA
jgi:hypothetical protein